MKEDVMSKGHTIEQIIENCSVTCKGYMPQGYDGRNIFEVFPVSTTKYKEFLFLTNTGIHHQTCTLRTTNFDTQTNDKCAALSNNKRLAKVLAEASTPSPYRRK